MGFGVKGIVMLRIWVVPEHSGVTIRLEGKLLSPWCNELTVACEQAAAQGLPLKIDLSSLVYVDAAGAELLRALIHKYQIGVARCSTFVAELLSDLIVALHGE